MFACNIWIFLFLTVTKQAVFAFTFQDVDNLYSNLTSGYNKEIRPETNQSVITSVSASFNMVALQNIDEVEGTVTVSGFFALSWVDSNLNWNPGDYQNIQLIELPHNIVWKPPVVNINSVKTLKIMNVDNVQVIVTYDGTVTFYPGDSYTFTCDIDSSNFPFDTQDCTMDVLAWGFSNDKLEFQPGFVNTDLLATNSGWELTKTKIEASIVGSLNIPGFKVNFSFKRRSYFFIINLLLPVGFLAALNIFVFVLPQESGERVGFSITALLAVVVFLTIAQGLLPATATPRLASLYEVLIQDMVVSGGIVVSVIIGSWIYHRSDDKPIPKWIQKLVAWTMCKCKADNTRNHFKESNSVHAVEISVETKQKTDNDTDESKAITWKRIPKL